MSVVILDIDGTLVDTNYHHTLAWFRAFRQHGVVLPMWRIHRHMGMGGDQLVSAMTDDQTEREQGEDIRAAEKVLYMAMIEEVQPMADARELIEELDRRGHSLLLASSAKQDEVERYLDLLDARELVDGWTTSAEVKETKPEPDLVQAALEKSGGSPREAVMIGDTPWDVKAAAKVGVPTIAVLTGGFARAELTQAGAVAVFESVAELRSKLDRTLFRRATS